MDFSGLHGSKLFQIIIIVLVTLVLQFIGHLLIAKFVRKAVKKAKGETRLDERKREDTVITIVRTTYMGLIWSLAAVSILGTLGVNVITLLTGAGIVGVFFGLSAQNTVKDFLAGIFILVEKQYRVGDIITLSGGTTGINGATGTVEEITLRITKLRDDNGTLTTVRNGEPTIVTNKTFSYSSVLLDVTVTYNSDITKVEKTINHIGELMAKEEKWQDIITQPIKFVRIDNFTDQGVVVRAIGKVAPARQWDVAGEYRRRLLEAFNKEPKITIAHT
jgi:moderate conductance mechanosensitive channel